MDFKYINQELHKIRKNEESFLGMDGGNINANIWFCGVEFGSDLIKMSKYYSDGSVKYSDKDGFKVPYRENCPTYFFGSNYDRYLSAMYLNIFGQEKITEIGAIEKVLKKELYNQESKIFKLNLFPIGKKDISWDESIESKLGVEKDDYYGTIFNNRKAFIKKLVKHYEPKLIICTSTKDYRETFVETFVDENKKVDFSWSLFKNKFKISAYDNDITKVIIIPFLGMGDMNLNSYDKVIKMAGYLRKEYSEVLEQDSTKSN